MPGYRVPAFYPGRDYVRVGPTIVLPANAAYYAKYPDDPAQLLRHHLFQSCCQLAEPLP